MSCELSRVLSFLIGRNSGMSDREATAWAAKEEAERDLKRERAKVSWLCRELEQRDHLGRSAESWEALADLYGNGR